MGKIPYVVVYILLFDEIICGKIKGSRNSNNNGSPTRIESGTSLNSPQVPQADSEFGLQGMSELTINSASDVGAQAPIQTSEFGLEGLSKITISSDMESQLPQIREPAFASVSAPASINDYSQHPLLQDQSEANPPVLVRHTHHILSNGRLSKPILKNTRARPTPYTKPVGTKPVEKKVHWKVGEMSEQSPYYFESWHYDEHGVKIVDSIQTDNSADQIEFWNKQSQRQQEIRQNIERQQQQQQQQQQQEALKKEPDLGELNSNQRAVAEKYGIIKPNEQ